MLDGDEEAQQQESAQQSLCDDAPAVLPRAQRADASPLQLRVRHRYLDERPVDQQVPEDQLGSDNLLDDVGHSEENAGGDDEKVSAYRLDERRLLPWQAEAEDL